MKAILLLLVLLHAGVIYSYEYRIEKPILEDQSSPGHETITSLAIECVLSHNDKNSPPKDCLRSKNEIYEYISELNIDIPSIKGGEIPAKRLVDASSWPDDPTRQGSFYGAKAKINIDRKCKSFWGFLGYENYNDSISGGLFCNSHMGVLQFFHSQASKPAVTGKYTPEEYEETLEKVLSWAQFNFNIVTDSEILNEPYCEYFKKLRNSEAHSGIGEAFLPARLEKKLLQCKNNYRIDWIYSNKCANPMSSQTCTKVGDEREYQIVALGALLHMVQDSYSQSHVKRGDCSTSEGVVDSKIVCEPIEQYYDYLLQDGHKHGESDVMPISVSDTCSSSDIDDAVTASAVILWHAMYEKPEVDLIGYLKSSVYLNPYELLEPPKKGPVASGGSCFKECQ